ncbi:GNAT family N-acetyltransferase [Desulfogranum marinum]|uniref:GNAT family N-acetyltransferase n=1 Tax=Desulfogranum marinum TaxID=453220 RepID=UPI0019650765|nr:GNAT family N-acetyltransferase [Desulfogranum marinum]MBM9514770.1 GNAT family N-acetyltransferase [Desulfogranum marinum]
MPRLYLDEYHQALTGKHICIACREGILRDNFPHIVADIKFLVRHGIRTTLYHNMANRFANQKHFRLLADRLPETTIKRVTPEVDFYTHVLDREQSVFKLIFLERKYLCDRKGHRINTLTTQATLQQNDEIYTNINIAGVLKQICSRIIDGAYNRVHILPARKNTIKHELFTVEGTGTLIANNFEEKFIPAVTDNDVEMLVGILGLYAKKGFLKPRNKQYLFEHRQRFRLTMIDGIAVGCVEQIEIDPSTVELGALAISTRFRNQRVGVFTVTAFEDEAKKKGFKRIISLTNNPRLHSLYMQLGFKQRELPEYATRQAASPGVALFCKDII